MGPPSPDDYRKLIDEHGGRVIPFDRADHADETAFGDSAEPPVA